MTEQDLSPLTNFQDAETKDNTKETTQTKEDLLFSSASPDPPSDPPSFADRMKQSIQSKASAEESLLLTLVSAIQKLEVEVHTERTERIRLETEIKERNVTDDDQLAHLTKTVDTLLYNLQGYESSAIAREDDNEIERANQAKRRSLEKKKKLKEDLRVKEAAEKQAAEVANAISALNKKVEDVEAKAVADVAKAEAAAEATVAAAAAATEAATAAAAAVAAAEEEEDEELKASKVAFAKAKALAEEQDRVQDLQRKEKELEMSQKGEKEQGEAKRWYAASIIQVAYRHYRHMSIWKSATDFGRERVKGRCSYY